MLSTRTRTIITSLIAAAGFATATLAPAVSQADKVAPKTPAVTCPGSVSASPGDTRETTVTTKSADGSSVKETSKEICGSDGKWHTVATLETSGKTVRSLPAAIKAEASAPTPLPTVKKVASALRSIR
jgi:hypothetical protein